MRRAGSLLVLLIALCAWPDLSAAYYPASVRESDGLTAYWRLGETAGPTVNDSVASGNGTALNGPTFGAPGIPASRGDTAVAFDGVDDRVVFDDRYDFTGLSAFSYELWFKPDTVRNNYVWVLDKEIRTPTRNGYGAVIRPSADSVKPSRPQCERWVNGKSLVAIAQTPVTAGQWYHLTCVFDGARMSAYVNGVREELTSATTDQMPDTTAELSIGGSSGGGSTTFHGSIDEVALWDRAISTSTIAARSAAGASSSPPPATTITASPPTITRAPTATFAFSSDADDATFECKLDGGAWTACTSPRTLPAVTSGQHTFNVRAKDSQSTDPSPASFTWTVEDSYTASVMDSRPLSFWRLNETSGAAKDAVSTRDGAFSGPAGSRGTAGLLFGDTDKAIRTASGAATYSHVDVPDGLDFAGNVPFSVELWFSPETVDSQWRRIISKEWYPAPTQHQGWDVTYQKDAGFLFERWSDSSTKAGVNTVTTIKPGRVYHVVASYDGTTYRLFVNGQLARQAVPATPILLADTPSPLAINGSSYYGAASNASAGTIDDVAIYDRALTGTEITAHWQAGADTAAPQTTLTATPPPVSATATAQFSFSAADSSPVTYECRLDTGAWNDCSNVHTLNGLSLGAHTFSVRAIDRYGNADSTPATHSWTVENSYRAAVLDDRPGAYWRLGDNATTVYANEVAGPAISNLFANPDVEQDTNLISAAGSGTITRVSSWSASGTFAARLTDATAQPRKSAYLAQVSGTTGGMPVTAAETYTASVAVGPSTASPTGLTLQIDWYDTNGTLLSSSASPPNTALDQTLTLRVSAPAPVGATRAQLQLYADSAVSSPTDVRFDQILFAKASSAETAWVAGSQPPGAWNGAAHSSTSSGPATQRATRTAGVTSTSGALFGDSDRAARFDGVDDEASLEGPQISQTGTLEGWFKMQGTNPVLRDLTYAGGWMLAYVGGDGQLAFRVAGVQSSVPVTFADVQGTWHHYALVKDGSTARWYLDGQLKRTVTGVANTPAELPWKVMRNGKYTSQFTRGEADEIAIYPHALTDAQILAHFQAGQDTQAPDTTITSGPTSATQNRTPTFAFSSDDSNATFECRIDTSSWTACTSGFAPAALTAGEHTFSVRATDPAGNTDLTAASTTWTVETSYRSLIMDDQPASYWPLDETFGTDAADLTANAHGAYNGPVQGAGGLFGTDGTSVMFDGQDDLISAAPSTLGSAQQVTVETWVNLSSTGKVHALIANTNSDYNDGYALTVNFGLPRWTVGRDGVTRADIAATRGLIANRWYHLAGTYDGDTARLYVNGSLAASASYTGGIAYVTTRQLRLGSQVKTSGREARFLHGRLDEPAVYRHALTAELVAAHFEAGADRQAPTLTVTSSPAARTSDAQARFAFSASDATAVSFQCQLDDGVWEECVSPMTRPVPDGSHHLDVMASDEYGNTATVRRSWTVDTQAPSANFEQTPASLSATRTARFEVRSDDPDVTTECQLDTAAWGSCPLTFQLSALTEGPHALRVRVTDQVGNARVIEHVWTVDTVAPNVTISSAPPALTAARSALFELAVSEPASETECQLDDQSWTVCPSRVELRDLADGDHRLRVRARDRAGNISTVVEHRWTVRTSAPTTQLDVTPSRWSAQNDAQFRFSSNEPDATFQCRLDGTTWQTCRSPHQVAGLSEGAHNFEARAVSRAGVHDNDSASYAWTVDTVAPAVQLSLAANTEIRDGQLRVKLLSDEPGVRFECQFNGGVWEDCGSDLQRQLNPGRYVLAVRAIDRAGNAASAKQVSFQVADAHVEGDDDRQVNLSPPVISPPQTNAKTLTCKLSLPDNAPSATFIWRRDGKVVQQSADDAYIMKAGDDGRKLQCAVTITMSNGHTQTLTSQPIVTLGKTTLSAVSTPTKVNGTSRSLPVSMTLNRRSLVLLRVWCRAAQSGCGTPSKPVDWVLPARKSYVAADVAGLTKYRRVMVTMPAGTSKLDLTRTLKLRQLPAGDYKVTVRIAQRRAGTRRHRTSTFLSAAFRKAR